MCLGYLYVDVVLDNVLGEAAGEAGAVRLDIDLGHGAVLHQHRESLAPGHSHPHLVAGNIIIICNT